MLLSSTEFSKKLEVAFISSENSIIVLSAFIKASALEWMLDHANCDTIKVVARWQKHDLICGASDFDCYKICKDRNVKFGISLNLHGKVYCADNQIFVGSANLTNRGMALARNFNHEFGIGFLAGISDTEKVENYLNNVIWLDDKLAHEMQQEFEAPRTTKIVSEEEWSTNLFNQLSQPVRHLWMHELLFTNPSSLLNFNADDEHDLHDYELLGLNVDGLSKETITHKFKQSNAYRWMQNLLDEEKSLSFGAVSAKLHNAILDDPLPYRKEIKELVVNLFAWFELLPNEFEISRPRHSQIIRIIN